MSQEPRERSTIESFTEGLNFSEPTCIKCGCTTYNACVREVHGESLTCDWWTLDAETNRGICTFCKQEAA